MPILESALPMKGLALVDAGIVGRGLQGHRRAACDEK